MTYTPTNNCPKHGGTMKSCNPNCAPKNRPAPLRFANAVDTYNYAALKKSHASLIRELKDTADWIERECDEPTIVTNMRRAISAAEALGTK